MFVDDRHEPNGAQCDRQLAKFCGAMLQSLCAALAVILSFALLTPANAQQQAVPVGTVYAERKPIAQTRDFVGRIEAIDRVSIQARVKGYLEAVLFKEGDVVKKELLSMKSKRARFRRQSSRHKARLSAPRRPRP